MTDRSTLIIFAVAMAVNLAALAAGYTMQKAWLAHIEGVLGDE